MRSSLALVRKDILVLARSPLLLAALVVYPLLVAVLVGLVVTYANAKPRVALVDRDGIPDRIVLAGQTFDVQRVFDRVAKEVELVRLSGDEAERQLETGRVVAALTVPPGFVSELRGMRGRPQLVLETTRGGLAPRVTQQVQALVFALNRELEDAYVEANLGYVELLVEGGRGTFLGREYELLGLDGVERLLADLPREERLDAIRTFTRTARLALAQTGDALRATARPIELVEAGARGRSWALSAQVQAYALALTAAFLALLLAAGALAAERDENVVGRLARGLVPLGSLVVAKMLLAAVVAVVLGLVLAAVFGVIVELGDAPGGQPWGRLPLVAAGLAFAGASLGALGALLGALAREARSASLLAVLVVVPVVLLGLIPRAVVPAAGAAGDALPFAHAVRLFAAALFDASPWTAVATEAAWLAALALVFGVLARIAAPRLLT